MSERVILGPGVYRLRGGDFAKTVYIDHGRWYGHQLVLPGNGKLGDTTPGRPMSWRRSGLAAWWGDEQSPEDIIESVDSEEIDQ